MDDNEVMQQTAARLKKLQKVLGFQTVDQFADYIGVPLGRLSNWLNGSHFLPPTAASVLQTKAGVTLDWLYTGDTHRMASELVARLTEPSEAPSLDPVISDAAYEIWALFQAKFNGGERPPRSRWDAKMEEIRLNPDIGHPFEDCAIEGAKAAYEVITRYVTETLSKHPGEA